MTKRHGKCMCGAVSFEVEKTETEVSACHCSMCRQWGSGPLFSLHHSGPLTISGEEHITYYKSSDWAHRAFCKECGSSLFYLFKEKDYFINAGLFEDTEGFEMQSQIYIDKKPDYYGLSNDCRVMTEAEVIAMYTPLVEGETLSED